VIEWVGGARCAPLAASIVRESRAARRRLVTKRGGSNGKGRPTDVARPWCQMPGTRCVPG